MTAVRTLLTVVVAAALLGASMPAVEEARGARTATSLDATATRLTDTATTLVATDDPVPPGERGASRTVVVTLRRTGLADARVDYFVVGGVPGETAPSTISYRIAGRTTQRVDAGVTFVTGAEPLVLEPGRHVLRLTLVRTGTGVGVSVQPRSYRSGTATNSSRAAALTGNDA